MPDFQMTPDEKEQKAQDLTKEAEKGNSVAKELNNIPFQERAEIAHRMEAINSEHRTASLTQVEIKGTYEKDFGGQEHLTDMQQEDKSKYFSSWRKSDVYDMPNQNVALADATTMARLSGFLQTKGRTYRIQGSAFTSLTNLREGPVILVGAFTNPWTIKLTGPLRYSFKKSDTTNFSWIEDRLHPEQRKWAMDWSQPYQADTEDYAVISRLKHAATDRPMLIVAGMGKYGTIAAGEFLTDQSYMDAFARAAPAGWENRNVQIVLATNVIKGTSGPPRVVVSHFW